MARSAISRAESGIRAHPGKGMGVGVADYDLDGRMDIFVANDKSTTSLFHNKGRRQVRGGRLRCRRGAARRWRFHIGHGGGFPRPRQRRLSGHRVRCAERRDIPVIPKHWEGSDSRMSPRESGMARLSTADGGLLARTSSISTTMAGRICSSSRGHVQSLAMPHPGQRGAAEHGVPQPGRREVGGAHRGGRASTAQPRAAPSRIGDWRSQRRWPARRGGDARSARPPRSG